MRVRNMSIWALLFCIPVALLAMNCASADVTADQNDTQVMMNPDLNNSADISADQATADQDLNLEEGATDGHRRWGGGWGGGRWGGWGGYGSWGGYGGWGGYGSYWPSYSWYWPSYGSYWGW